MVKTDNFKKNMRHTMRQTNLSDTQAYIKYQTEASLFRIPYKVWIIAAAVFVTILMLFNPGILKNAYAADSLLDGQDGTYSVSLNLSGLTMGADNFDSTAKLEKQGGKYYLYFRQKDTSSIKNANLVLDGKQVGNTVVEEDGNEKITCYTLSKESLKSSLTFTAYIPQMDKTVNFSVSVELDSAVRQSGEITSTGERPAEFVPVITADSAGDSEAAQGSVFLIRAATAAIGSENCEVTVRAYYMAGDKNKTEAILLPVFQEKNGEKVITGYKLKLENAGEYHYVYRAESPIYKTSSGNNTSSEMNVKVVSKVGGIDLAKFTCREGVVPKDTTIQASKLSEGSIYDVAAAKMKTIADNFELYNIAFIGSEGNEVHPSGSVDFFIKANQVYNRNKIIVYFLGEDGFLTKLPSEGYGRYIKFYAEETGTFIVCVPGVAFKMSMWGYAAIAGGVALLLAGGSVWIILAVRKNKKLRKI